MAEMVAVVGVEMVLLLAENKILFFLVEVVVEDEDEDAVKVEGIPFLAPQALLSCCNKMLIILLFLNNSMYLLCAPDAHGVIHCRCQVKQTFRPQLKCFYLVWD